MPVEERTFQIQLEGLIQLLAQNLYADPDVFLREMIQNAHDSIMRRAALVSQRGGGRPGGQTEERSQVAAAHNRADLSPHWFRGCAQPGLAAV
jgi:HSP90 family molecular chaperone